MVAIRGFTTVSLICLTVQYISNELKIARVRYVARETVAPTSTTNSLPQPAISSAITFPMSGSAVYEKMASPVPLEPFQEPIFVDTTPPKPISQRLFDKLSGLFSKIPDDEYLDMTKRKRDAILQRIEQLKVQIAAEEEAKRKDG